MVKFIIISIYTTFAPLVPEWIDCNNKTCLKKYIPMTNQNPIGLLHSVFLYWESFCKQDFETMWILVDKNSKEKIGFKNFSNSFDVSNSTVDINEIRIKSIDIFENSYAVVTIAITYTDRIGLFSDKETITTDEFQYFWIRQKNGNWAFIPEDIFSAPQSCLPPDCSTFTDEPSPNNTNNK